MEEVGVLSTSEAYAPPGGSGPAIPAPDPEYLMTRLTTTTLVVQALLARLAVEGRLVAADVAGVEASVLDAARRLQAQPAAGPQEVGTRLERDVRAFFAALSPPRSVREAAIGSRSDSPEGRATERRRLRR